MNLTKFKELGMLIVILLMLWMLCAFAYIDTYSTLIIGCSIILGFCIGVLFGVVLRYGGRNEDKQKNKN